jgi:hypothetical protein
VEDRAPGARWAASGVTHWSGPAPNRRAPDASLRAPSSRIVEAGSPPRGLSGAGCRGTRDFAQRATGQTLIKSTPGRDDLTPLRAVQSAWSAASGPAAASVAWTLTGWVGSLHAVTAVRTRISSAVCFIEYLSQQRAQVDGNAAAELPVGGSAVLEALRDVRSSASRRPARTRGFAAPAFTGCAFV